MINYRDDTNLEYKMEIMKMVNELNVNQKVGRIWIKLDNDNQINDEIIRMIINSCNNVYYISIRDDNDSVDNMVHD